MTEDSMKNNQWALRRAFNMDSAFLKAMSKLIWRNVKMRYGGEPSSLDYDKDLILCKSKNEKTAEHIPKFNKDLSFY